MSGDFFIKVLVALVWLVAGVIIGAGVSAGYIQVDADMMRGGIIIACSLAAGLLLAGFFVLMIGIHEYTRRMAEAIEKMGV